MKISFLVTFKLQSSNNSRQNISSGGKYEKLVGYSRAVKVGNLVFVSGTTGFKEGGALDPDSYGQAVLAMKNIEAALQKAGCTLQNVVRTRVFLSSNADWKQVGRAHAEFFGKILPASSMLVCSFLDPAILVEIEADAVLDS